MHILRVRETGQAREEAVIVVAARDSAGAGREVRDVSPTPDQPLACA